jgi:hypothetical protein
LISKCFLHVRMATFGQMQVLWKWNTW